MKKLFTRIPLPAKLILTGLIPLVFVIYISIQLLSERTKKANLLRSYVDRIHQSADMTNLIDRLQGERNKTYEYALKKTGQPEMVAERRQTDSLIRRLQNYPFLSNFTDYTFLGNLDTVRNSIDSGKYAPNQVVHYYTTIIFRLNTLNPVPIGASIYVPEASHDINSQKLLSEIITYLGITSTNIYTALYTRAYVVETLVGSIGTYQVFNSYEKEFFVKARPIVIRSYKDIRESGALKETVTYLDTVFRTFVIDSTYTAANWKSVSDAAIEQLRQLQHGILQDVSQKVNEIYTDVQRAKDTSLALLAIALILVIAIIAYTIYSINDSLLKLKRDAEKISRGEPGVHINGVTNDVIGVLARSIRKIDQNNKVLAQAADAIGRGDFAVEVKPRSTNDELGNAILQMKKGLQQFTQDLAKSEKRNRQMLELLPAAVYSCGMDGHLKSYNKAAVELWGQEPDLSKDKWTGAFKTFNSDNILLTPDESPMSVFVREGVSSSDQEFIIERPDGSRRFVMPHIQFVYDGLGNVTEVIDMVTDITERKLAEKDTANLAAIVQSSDDAIISKTLEGIVTSWNIGAEKVFGYTAEEMIGESITKLIPQERLDEETMILTQIKQGKGIEQFSTIRVTKSGKRIHISLTTSPVKDRKGRVIGASKIARDISAAIEAACKIEESEERLRLAIEATKLGTWDYQPSTGELNWSEECKRIYALPPGLEIDFKIFEEHIYPDDKALALGAVAKAMDPEGEGEYDLEYRIIRFDDNGVRWIRAQGKVFFDDMGQPGRFIGTVVEITEQKQSQIALEESEQRTRLAIEAAKLGTFEWDLVTMDFSGSQRLLNIFGHSERGSLTHKDIMEAFHPDDKPIRDKAVELAREKGELRYEVRVFWPDKSLHWITVYGKMVYDKNHSPLRMYGTVMDVTDEKITRNALEESEQRFKIIANTAPVMIWMSGTDKFADFFNISWLNFTGRTMSQESGDGWLEGVHPDDRPRCVAVYNEAHAKEQAFAIEYRLRNRHGLYRWISDNAVPRVTPEGKFIGFISASRDIDDEKRFNEKLKESELLFKTITNVSPVALWMTDAGGKNNYVNDTWLEWTGMAQERQHDRGWMSSMIEADREGVGRHFNICFEKREVFSAEFRYKRKDAEVRWVYSEGSPYYDIDGVFAGYAGSVVDITERKQDEIRKNEFLAVASHELKTPLTSVKAYAQLLASKYEKTQDAFLNNAVLKIDNQVNKMTKLVGDFLNLAKIESDKFQLNTERFAIMELVKEISYDMQLVSGQHKIVVEQREEVEVVADREKIAQVITNLLNNAVKYSPEDKNILISVGRKNGQAKVSVIDKGIGIKREEQEKIFERFYRSKFNNNISFSGFGIGLYISAEIIRKHSGDIGVESEFGKGATFYFTLPVAN